MIKLDNAGNYLWGKIWNVNNNTDKNDYSRGLDIDDNHLYWAVYNSNLVQTQIIRISNNGIVKWKKDLLNATHQSNTIACQKNKHRLVITGNPTSYGSMVDNYLLDKPFVIILDTNKNIVNVDVITNSNILPSAFQAQSVYTNSNDDIILTGTFTGSFTIKGLNISGSSNSAWIAQFNDNFNFAYWAANTLNSYGSKINGVCTDNAGQVYVTGTTGTGTSIAFGNISLTKANPTDILTAKIDGMVSVPHQSPLSQTLHIFPNPSDGTFFIQSEYPTKIVISNVLGQTIKEENIEPHTYHALHLSVPSGIYFLQDAYTNQKMKILISH
ncbi:MAG: hypothetical protein Fur0023_20910 [Bacteroidia bacterium]